MDTARRLAYPVGRDSALDFGCGVGRATRALADHFETCVGVDISETMIAEARRLAGGGTRCHFVTIQGGDLAQFESGQFDLVYSVLVLQHLEGSDAIRTVITELVRVCARRGLLVFQLPRRLPVTTRLALRARTYRVLRGLGVPRETLYNRLRLHPSRMHFLDSDEVAALLRSTGAAILHTEAKTDESGSSATYYVTHL